MDPIVGDTTTDTLKTVYEIELERRQQQLKKDQTVL